MTYSCTDFTDDILDALKIDVPDEDNDSPSAQADLALAEIKRLQTSDGKVKLLEDIHRTKADNIKLAAMLIRAARAHLRAAGADKAADYVQRALKSVEGAERHARGLETRKREAHEIA